MTGDFTLQLGFSDAMRPDAAQLYWQAFGGKLGFVMGPEPRALTYFQRVMRKDQAIVAIGNHGALLGIAGFKTPEGSFASGNARDLRAIYGIFGGFWRGLLLSRLSDEVDNHRFLLDGLCVQPAFRSRGIGSALLKAISAEAWSRGYDEVRLDVVDTNWRAVALYKRLGFVVLSRQHIGLLRHVFGFSSATTMVYCRG